MNVFRKFTLIHHITKDLTPRSSFARKALIPLKVNEISLPVRLSPLFPTSASFTSPPPRASRPRRVGLRSKTSPRESIGDRHKNQTKIQWVALTRKHYYKYSINCVRVQMQQS